MMKQRLRQRKKLFFLSLVIVLGIAAAWGYTRYIQTEKYDPVANATEL